MNIQERKNKEGKITSFRIRVFDHRDAQTGKVILDDSIYRSDKQAYLVSAPVYAAQMGEYVEFTLYNSTGEPQQLWNASGQNFYMGICIKQGGISAMQPAAALTLCVSLL